MEGSFVPDYFLLVFAASLGLFQMAASYNGLRGLMLFESRHLAFGVGAVVLVGAFGWFFLSELRNLPDTGPGLTGNEQFGYFFAGGGAGLAVTLVVTSLKNWGLGRGMPRARAGLDGLRESNYLRCLVGTVERGAKWVRDARNGSVVVERSSQVGSHAEADD